MDLWRERIKGAVDGEARVIALAPTKRGARQAGRLSVQMRLTLDVSTRGVDPVRIEHVDVVPHDKSPLIGDVLAVTFAPANPSILKIDWSGAPDLATRARAAGAAAQRSDTVGAVEALGFTLKEDDHE